MDVTTSFHNEEEEKLLQIVSSKEGGFECLPPLVVGVVHSAACLNGVAQDFHMLATGAGIDLLEVRLDSLDAGSLPSKWPLPVIATARHPAEGGEGNLKLEARRKLLEEALSWAALLDIELLSAEELASTLTHAREKQCQIILSYHDFNTVPSLALLQELAGRAKALGADCFKVAATINNKEELLRLLEFQKLNKELPLATMGMGHGGKLSRLLLSALGSRLSYGWLYRPQVQGQWSAWELTELFNKKALVEVKS